MMGDDQTAQFPPECRVSQPENALIAWLLDSDPAVRWQVLRDLLKSPADEVAAERARVSAEGWGTHLLALQAVDDTWGREGWNRVWDSTMHVLMLLRDFGLAPVSLEARRSLGLVRDRVTRKGCGPKECDEARFLAGHKRAGLVLPLDVFRPYSVSTGFTISSSSQPLWTKGVSHLSSTSVIRLLKGAPSVPIVP